MKTQLANVLLVFVVLIGCGPATEKPDPAAEAAQRTKDIEAVKAIPAKYAVAYNAADTAGLAAVYANDAIRMPPNEPPVVGNEAITASFQAIFDQFTPGLKLSPEEVNVDGGLGFIRGTYEITLTPRAEGETMQDDGKYVVIVQKQSDGSWKTYRAIWNSNNPLPGGDN